ncbi:hypothetical protein [Bartonella sp. HY761]|uniref:hypothetical protein n=1 Tax=Bartonella sp. HY761 TaxID=2979330 RepID=UPI002204E5FB|nr:hypothetical protein [Bartonella sp. HY761]UXN05358.1 hypothetical protein N6A79_08500 [Bartonella sp. HY761]
MANLFEVHDERTEENFSGPMVEITNSSNRDIYKKISARFNLRGFEDYSDKIDEYECNSIQIYTENILKNKFKFNPNFSHIKNKEKIECFTIAGEGSFAPDFNMITEFNQFPNVKSFLAGFKFGKNITSLFPSLEALCIMGWRFSKFKTLGDAWPNLRYLALTGFSDDLEIFAGRDLRRINLQESTQEDFEKFSLFPNLKAIGFTFPRGEANISALSDMNSLEALNIEGGKKLFGWKNFYSSTLKRLYANYCPLENLKEHFPNLEDYAINFRMDGPRVNQQRGGDMGKLQLCYTEK